MAADGRRTGVAMTSNHTAEPVSRRRLLAVLVFSGLFTLPGEQFARIDLQYGSPLTGSRQPDPALCQVEPRPIAFFEALAATPVAALATPASLTPTTIAGESADAQTLAEIEAAVDELAACRSAGDVLRLDALYTDDYFLRQVAISGPPSEQVVDLLAASPVPLPEAQQSGSYIVRDVEVLPDGRVRAVIGLELPRGDVSLLTVFERKGERWLIDEETIAP